MRNKKNTPLRDIIKSIRKEEKKADIICDNPESVPDGVSNEKNTLSDIIAKIKSEDYHEMESHQYGTLSPDKENYTGVSVKQDVNYDALHNIIQKVHEKSKTDNTVTMPELPEPDSAIAPEMSECPVSSEPEIPFPSGKTNSKDNGAITLSQKIDNINNILSKFDENSTVNSSPDDKVVSSERTATAGEGENNPSDYPCGSLSEHFLDKLGEEEDIKNLVDAISGADDIPAVNEDNDPETEDMLLDYTPVQSGGKKIITAKKTLWSEVEDEGDQRGVKDTVGVVSVNEVQDYADLILPHGATLELEEFHVKPKSGSLIVSGQGDSVLLSELDSICEGGIASVDIDISKLEIAPPEEEKTGRFNPLKSFKFRNQVKEDAQEYDPRIHGPLVDLEMEDAEGIEEIELYPVNEPYAYVRIIYDKTSHEYIYRVIEPTLTNEEKELISELEQRLFETLDVNTKDLTKESAEEILKNSVDEIILDYGIKLSPPTWKKIFYYITRSFLGDGLIDPLMHDKFIEDISCDGLDTPVFIYHSNYESLQSSLIYTNSKELDSFVTRLAQRAGKYISIAEPMPDATMEDGSRIQMTLGQEVTARGSTFTIRKFKDEPITPTDLIEWSTFSPLSVAYIWLAVENGKSCIFAGGTASGKTTSLNAISLFIPPLAKIVTLEDTRELKLPHQNWIPSVTRESFDADGKGTIDMYELLRAALRQRPEYLLVGEVRGQEALTLFQAMSTGHVTYATMHADSVASVVHRLENPPLNVPRNMLNALDLVSVQVQARVGGQRIRRNKQLIEVLDIDPRTRELITNEVFKWNPATDEIRYSGKSFILEEIMEARGWDEERMREELKRRQEILEWMRIKKLRHYHDVSKVLMSYYRDPDAVMDLVRRDLEGVV